MSHLEWKRNLDTYEPDDEEPEPHIGMFIRQSRQDRLMTQIELARRAGISRTHLSGIERCKSDPSYRVVKSICQVLGVEPWQTWEPVHDTEAIDLLRLINERTYLILQAVRGQEER